MTNNQFSSQLVSVFHDRTLPEQNMLLAGYAAIINHYNLKVPLPTILAAISSKHRKYEKDNWQVFTPRHAPEDTLYGHLTFALKYEGVDLSTLKMLFDSIDSALITKLITDEPLGVYSRRIWFLYEWLTEKRLEIDNLSQGNFVTVIDENIQYPGPSRNEARYRVRNNLPGVKDFCPLIRRTKILDSFIGLKLKEKAQRQLSSIRTDILMRAASFLLLKDSKASYAIEGESPTYSRAEKWAKAIGQAGHTKLSKDELIRLQNIVITDQRFVKMGYRKNSGFIGIHDRDTRLPIPEHISAKWEDCGSLIQGLLSTNELLLQSHYDPVLTAAIIAFGFVFIHPFEDGNGRIHRYLLHHVLSEKGFVPENATFPISSSILSRIVEYKNTLEEYSKPRLELIRWRPSLDGNVEVLSDTIDLYRYFDATKQAEFLYKCVQETIDEILPEEIQYLQNYDELKTVINSHLDMPENKVDLLISFLHQGKGVLSKRALEKEFFPLTEVEKSFLEKAYLNIFTKEG